MRLYGHGLNHQGSDLKKRKHAQPNPKHCNSIPYCNITRQNDWIRENLFNPMDNYLFGSSCIWVALSLSRQNLAHQREIKRKQSTQPLRHMTKSDVEKECVSEYVMMPADKEMVFKEWWMKLDASDFASVQYPHARHGNAGRTSNSSKTSVMEDFLAFVDTNSQPNGRKADSTRHTFYFLLKFSTLQTPKAGCPHYEERLSRSVAGEFTVRNRQKSMF